MAWRVCKRECESSPSSRITFYLLSFSYCCRRCCEIATKHTHNQSMNGITRRWKVYFFQNQDIIGCNNNFCFSALFALYVYEYEWRSMECSTKWNWCEKYCKNLQYENRKIARDKTDWTTLPATVSSVDVEPVSGIFALCMVWRTVFLTWYRFCCFAVFSARLCDSSSLPRLLSRIQFVLQHFIRFLPNCIISERIKEKNYWLHFEGHWDKCKWAEHGEQWNLYIFWSVQQWHLAFVPEKRTHTGNGDKRDAKKIIEKIFMHFCFRKFPLCVSSRRSPVAIYIIH